MAKVATAEQDVALLQTLIRKGSTQGHYYVALLGLREYDPLRLYRIVRGGLKYSAIERFQRNTDLSARTVADLADIPLRTLARRKEEGRLLPEESDRLVRASRVFGRALELFEGSIDLARQWLSTPQLGLGGMVPLQLATTDVGAEIVEQLIGRLEHGIPG